MYARIILSAIISMIFTSGVWGAVIFHGGLRTGFHAIAIVFGILIIFVCGYMLLSSWDNE